MITAGFDIGTRFVKVALVEDGSLLGSAMEESGKELRAIIRRTFRKALEKSGVRKKDVKRRIATGFGSSMVRGADSCVPEAPCLARALNVINPEVRLVIDVGGLFINVIGVNVRGFVDGALVNDRCAAGSGKFLEMVSENLSVPFTAISDLALSSNSPYVINSQCAVFAESEIISQVNGGREGRDILAGVLKSIVGRAVNLVERSDAAGRAALCGGISRLPAFRVLFEKMTGGEVYLPVMDPQLVTAYGAALIGQMRSGAERGRNVSPGSISRRGDGL